MLDKHLFIDRRPENWLRIGLGFDVIEPFFKFR